MSSILTFAISPCPNDIFLYSGLILGKISTPGWKIQFEFEDIETLNHWSNQGRCQALKISFAQLPKIVKQYRLLRCGGALGRGCGPLLLTGGEELISTRLIEIPGVATTANALLDFYLKAEWPKIPFIKSPQRFDLLYEHLKADPKAQGVVIHEMRFTYEADGLRLIQDLGAYWEAKMKVPIPLGALVLNRKSDLQPATLEAWVRDSLDWGTHHFGEALDLCRLYSKAMDEAVMRQHIDLYVNDFSRELGSEGESAVAQFLRHQECFDSVY